MRPLALAAACLAASLPAIASPDVQIDTVGAFLTERGLIDNVVLPPESPLVREVRSRASDMVMSAMNFLGVPYRRGGDSADDGFDCSGFTRRVFEISLGLMLPHRADAQASAPGMVPIQKSELQPGDLVFFNTLRRTFSHVGIYIGEGRFIHAPRTGGEVRVEDMRFPYWDKRFTGARRAEPLVAAATPPARPAAASAPGGVAGAR